ncbi:myosin-9-like [Brachionichthys hirsutus]|uniref:myosin-9-like n=1 Tax=Brachionichthys hirsutus TaxID=412623 RepID=UPI0036052F4C
MAQIEDQKEELNSLKASLKDAQQQLEEDRQQKEFMQSEICPLNSQLVETSTLQSEITALRLKLHDEEQQRSTLEQKILCVSQRNANLRDQIEWVEKQRMRKSLYLMSRRDKMKKYRDIHGAHLGEHKAELKSLNASLKDAQQRLEIQKLQLEQDSKQKEFMQREICTLNSQLVETTNNLQSEIAALRLKLRGEEQQRSTLEQNELILSSNNMSLKATIDQLVKNQVETNLGFSSQMDEMGKIRDIHVALQLEIQQLQLEEERKHKEFMQREICTLNSQLVETTNNLQTEIAALRLKLHAEEHQRSTLEQNELILSYNNMSLKATIDQLVKNQVETNLGFSSQMDEMGKNRDIHVALVEHQKAALNSLNASLKDAQQQLEIQQLQLEADRKQKEVMQRGICTLNSQLVETTKNLQSEIAALRLKLRGEEQQRSTSEQNELILSSNNMSLKATIDQLEKIQVETNLGFSSQMDEMGKIRDIHVALQLEIQQLQLEEERKQKELMLVETSSMKDQLTNIQAEMSELRLKLHAEEQQRSTWEQNELILSSNNMSLKATIDQLEKIQQLEIQQLQLEEDRKQKEVMQREICTLKSALSNETNTLQSEITALRRRLIAIKKQRHCYMAQLEELKAELNSLNASLKDAQQQLEIKQLQLEEERKQKEFMQREICTLNSQLVETTNNLQSEIAALRLKLHGEEQQRSTLEQNELILSSNNMSLKATIDQLEKIQQLEIQQLQLEEERKQKELMLVETSSMKDQLTNIQAEMSELRLKLNAEEQQRSTLEQNELILSSNNMSLKATIDQLEKIQKNAHQSDYIKAVEKEMEMTILKFKSQIDEMKRNTDIHVALLEQQKQKAELNTQMDEMAKQKDQMEVSLTATLKEAEAEKNLLNETLKKKGQQCVEQMSELEDLRDQLHAKKAKKKWYRRFLFSRSK